MHDILKLFFLGIFFLLIWSLYRRDFCVKNPKFYVIYLLCQIYEHIRFRLAFVTLLLLEMLKIRSTFQ